MRKYDVHVLGLCCAEIDSLWVALVTMVADNGMLWVVVA